MIRGAILTLLVLTWIAPAAAQSTADAAPPVTFLTRYAFHLNAEHLSSDDPRFVWDANYGGELDLVDYLVGRFTFFANYQAIIGEEFRPIDPTQGNYTLGGRLSYRWHDLEMAGVFYHQSRHLSDRDKRQAVDWNMVGTRISKPLSLGAVALDTHVDIRGVIQTSFVDYTWEMAGGVRARYPLRRNVALVSDVDVRFLGTDDSRDRGTQTGARGEGGVRFEGRGAAFELFVAVERRIDPYPLEFGTTQWISVGGKLLSK